MLDKLKTALVLVVIGAISGLLIFGANEVTQDGIAANRLAKEQGYYREIFDLVEGADITTVTTDLTGDLDEEITVSDFSGTVLGYIYKSTETNNYGDITVLVGIAVDGTISKVIISSTTNTPTFVNKIEKNYLDPFDGQATDDVVYDARTGASYTYGSVSKFVEASSSYYEANRGDAS